MTAMVVVITMLVAVVVEVGAVAVTVVVMAAMVIVMFIVVPKILYDNVKYRLFGCTSDRNNSSRCKGDFHFLMDFLSHNLNCSGREFRPSRPKHADYSCCCWC